MGHSPGLKTRPAPRLHPSCRWAKVGRDEHNNNALFLLLNERVVASTLRSGLGSVSNRSLVPDCANFLARLCQTGPRAIVGEGMWQPANGSPLGSRPCSSCLPSTLEKFISCFGGRRRACARCVWLQSRQRWEKLPLLPRNSLDKKE